MTSCNLCPRQCRLDAPSFCGVRGGVHSGDRTGGGGVRVFRHRIEYSEEPHLVPSHLFYLSGCNLRCVFCIGTPNALDPTQGETLTPKLFRDAVTWGRQQGARTLQWVGGEPTVHADALIELMDQTPNLPPVVWKSNFYTTPDLLMRLASYVAHFVADFKFGNADCAKSLCGVSDYVDVVTESMRAIYAVRPQLLVVRHLLLPGHFECCFKPVWEWCQRNVPQAMFSLRDGYTPSSHARHDPVLGQWLSAEEANKAHSLVRNFQQ
ncbi:MAG: radical SAM protein [Thermoguttaceae bacterium]